jgi:hypothetical protein
MNAPARPAFQPMGLTARKKDIDQLASAATSYAVKENIPAQVHPRAVQPVGQGAAAASEPVVKLVSTEERFERFTVVIPTYLAEDIRKRLSTKKQTKKSLLLNAFKDAGFYVAAEDLIEDGRRGK